MTRHLRYSIAATMAALGLAAALAPVCGDRSTAARRGIAGAAPRASAGATWFDARLGSSPAGPAALDNAASAASAAVYGRNGRAIDLGGQTVAQYIAPRIASARMGDMRAAYEVYQAFSICAAIDEPAADYEDPAQLEQFQRERGEQQRLCASISPAQVQERMRFLTSAARAGIRDAQIDFYMEGPYGKSLQEIDMGSDPLATQWRTNALDFLKSAASQCDQFALGLLSNAYDAGEVVERSPALAVAYGMAAAAARHVTLSREQLLKRFGDQVSGAELDEGVLLGTQMALASSHCQ